MKFPACLRWNVFLKRSIAALALAAFSPLTGQADLTISIPTREIQLVLPTEFEGQAISSVAAAGGGDFNLGAFLGAGAYYNNSTPLTGQNTVTYNLEAGHIWNGHESLSHVTQFVQDTDAYGSTAAELYDRHATWAGMFIGGRQSASGGSLKQQGISYGTDLRSAAFATGWNGSSYALSFGISEDSYLTAFNTAFANADVINSSFGYTDPGGVDALTVYSDAMVFQNPTVTYVTSAGNSGPSPNTVGAPGSGYNTITVGALGNANAYDSVASFSSRGPQDFSYYSGNSIITISGVRAAVDISAPGTSLTSAFYGGQTGGNNPTLSGSINQGTSASAYSLDIAGTSFSAPLVAGGAALIASAAKTLPSLTSNEEARSSLITKSLLLTAADKTASWSNGQTTSNGVTTTTQSLDYNVGAGRMNLEKTFEIQTRGQTGVSGTSLGSQGTVAELGWDYGASALGTNNDYILSNPLSANTTFTTTLTWNRIREYEPSTGFLYEDAQANLNLSLWSLGSNQSFDTLVAQSLSLYNPVEHLAISIPTTGYYGLRVSYAGNTFDNLGFWGTGNFTQDYGIAWSGEAVPDVNWNVTSHASTWNATSGTTIYSDVIFSNAAGSPQTLSVSGTQSARGLSIQTGNLTIGGINNPSLNIGESGITISANATGPTTLAASLPLILSANQTWTNSSDKTLRIASETTISNGKELVLKADAGDIEIDGRMSGNGSNLRKTGNSTLTLSGNSSLSGHTSVEEGKLVVNGSLNSSQLSVESGGIIAGSGSVGSTVIQNGGILAPGNSPGRLTVNGNATWLGGASFQWQVASTNTSPLLQTGAGVNWDIFDVNGILTLSGLNNTAFNLNLWTLSATGLDTNGAIAGWSPSVGSTWLFASAAGGINLNGLNLSPNTDYTSLFHIHTEAFGGTAGWQGGLPSAFRVVTLDGASNLYLQAVASGTTPAPETNQVAASILCLILVGVFLALRRMKLQRGN
jgi:autotransporter-associated beta strand protein